MSKKVNIMADVDQNVYDAVVVPHKQSRTFTSLIETLLTGYYSNAYIRSFVDDELEGIQHESSDVLNDIINNMHKGLANMGVYTEEMKSNSQDGIDAFSKKAEEAKEEMKDIQAQEIKDIRESMDDLREQVRTQNEEILGMLKSLMSGGIVMQLEHSKNDYYEPFKEKSTVTESAEDLEGDITSSSVDTVVVAGDSSSLPKTEVDSVNEGTVDEDVEDSTSEEEALAIMSKLLEGNEFAF